MIDRVGNGKRVDVNFGLPERVTHAGERAEPIRKKDPGRFARKTASCVADFIERLGCGFMAFQSDAERGF